MGDEIYLTWYDAENHVSSINGSNLHTTLSDENVVKETWASVRKAVSGITLTAQSEGTSTISLTATINGVEKTYQFKINVKPSVWLGGCYYIGNGNKRPAIWRNGKLFKVFEDFTARNDYGYPYVSKIQFYKDKIYVMLIGSKFDKLSENARIMEGNIFTGNFNIYQDSLTRVQTNYSIADPLLYVSEAGDVYYTDAACQEPGSYSSQINSSFWRNKELIDLEPNRVVKDMVYVDEQGYLVASLLKSDFWQTNHDSDDIKSYIAGWSEADGMQLITTISHSSVNFLSYNNHKLVASGQYWYDEGTGTNRYAVWTVANKSYNTITNDAYYWDARAFSRGDTYVTGRILIRADATIFDYFNETNSSIYGVSSLVYEHGLGTVAGDYGYYCICTKPEGGSGRTKNVIVVYNLDQPMYEPEFIYLPNDVYNYYQLKTIEVQSSIL